MFGENGSTKTLTIAAADATNPRIDRVVLRCDTVAQDLEVLVITGVAAVSPSAPALVRSATQTDYSLCQVLVGTTVTSIVTANITDERQWASPRGIPRARGSTGIAAASTLEPYGPSPLTESAQVILVTGTTSITNIAIANAPPRAGSVLVLEFLNPGCTVVKGGNITIPRSYISGVVDSMLTLWWDSTQWLEMARSGEQAPAHQYFGNPTGTAAGATFAALVAADLPVYTTWTVASITQGITLPTSAPVARFAQLGKTIHAYGAWTLGTAGTANTAFVLTLPAALQMGASYAAGLVVGNFHYAGPTTFFSGAVRFVNATQIAFITNNVTGLFGTTAGGGPTAANSDVLYLSMTYEGA